jgi:hypothetical protein
MHTRFFLVRLGMPLGGWGTIGTRVHRNDKRSLDVGGTFDLIDLRGTTEDLFENRHENDLNRQQGAWKESSHSIDITTL